MEKGVYAESLIKELVEEGRVFSYEPSLFPIENWQVQPSSFEPKVGNVLFVGNVIDREANMREWGTKEELSDGYILKRGVVYRIPLVNGLVLPSSVCVAANPKSRMGRVGLNVRLIANDAPAAYDNVPSGYSGSLSLEIVSRAFDCVISPGMAFNQLRFMNAKMEDIEFSEVEMRRYLTNYKNNPGSGTGRLASGKEFLLNSFLFGFDGGQVSMDAFDFSANSLVLHNTVKFSNSKDVVVYRAKKRLKRPLDLRGAVNDSSDFFDELRPRDLTDGFVAIPGDFFLNSSSRVLHCPDDLIMVTKPFDPRYGDMKGDHAGFIDPGFIGTLTFEPIVYETMPFVLREGTPVMGLRIAPLIGQVETKYGHERGNAHLGQVGVKLGPFFKS